MKTLSMVISDEMYKEFEECYAQGHGMKPEIAALHRYPESHARELMFRAVQGYIIEGRAKAKKVEERQ